MPKLIAHRAILHQNRLYASGDVLPTYDSALVAAWLEAGSAEYESETREVVPSPASDDVKSISTSRSATKTKKGAVK